MIACDIRNRDIVQLLVEHSKIKGIDISIGQEWINDEMVLFIDSLQQASNTFFIKEKKGKKVVENVGAYQKIKTQCSSVVYKIQETIKDCSRL